MVTNDHTKNYEITSTLIMPELKTKDGNPVKRVIILGQGPGFENCPFEGVDEVWTLNMAPFKVKQCDRVFVMDPLETKTDISRGFYHGMLEHERGEKIPVTVEDYKQKLNDEGITLVSAYKYDGVEHYEPYPIREIFEWASTDYFANTVSYMIAYAIYHGVEYIEFWGVNQAAASEFIMHKGCIEFWIGIAVGLGIGIKIEGAESYVLRNPDGILYGYRMHVDDAVKHIAEKGELTYEPLSKRKKSIVSI